MLRTIGRWGTRLPEPVRRAVRDLPGVRWMRDRMVGTPRPVGPAPGDLRPVVYLPTWSQWDVMRQRQQYVIAAFAAAGHEAWFVDVRTPEVRRVDGVTIVPSLDQVPGHDVILYVHFAPVRTLFGKFRDPVVVYDILDDLSIYDPDETGTPAGRRVGAHHPALVRAADLVIVSSPVLADRHRPERADLELVPNGVDYARFSTPAPRPADLPPRRDGRPVVGFHGAVGDWIDLKLVGEVARAMPAWDFVMVGPVYHRMAGAAAALAAEPNVTLIGERPPDTMPGYVQAFDIGAVWFKIEHLTEAVTPLKLYEYLAAGLPVVGTELPVCRDEPLVHTAADAAGFVAALETALAESADPEHAARARAAGAAAGWGHRLIPVRERLQAAGKLRKA